jgi:hypothetical protein
MWMEAHLHPTPFLRGDGRPRGREGATHCLSLPHGDELVDGHAIIFSKAQLGSNAGCH